MHTKRFITFLKIWVQFQAFLQTYMTTVLNFINYFNSATTL